MNIQKLREKIKARTAELGIVTAHTDKGHFYKFNGQTYGSVTGKLAVVKDEGLMNWKRNRSIASVAEKWMPDRAYSKELIDAILVEATAAPQMEFEGAGSIGTAVHAWRQAVMNAKINGKDWPYSWAFALSDDRVEVKAACEGFKRCITELGAEPLGCEISLADEKLQLGGQLDDLWAVPVKNPVNDPVLGKGYKTHYEIHLIDLKTSNIGDKNSYMMQVALYWHMFRKLYHIKIDKVFILHVSKKVFGEYELIPVKYPAKYYQIAKLACKLSGALKELENLKKPVINKI